MVERPPKPTLHAIPAILVVAGVAYDHLPFKAWPELIARAHRLGVDSIIVRPRWAWHIGLSGVTDFQGQNDTNRDLVSLVRLCQAAQLTMVLDLGGLDTPPFHLLRTTPTIAIPEPGGFPHIPPLHPALLEETRQWITHLSALFMPFQQPDGPIAALLITHLSALAMGVLEGWIQNTGWQIPLLRRLATIDLTAGWPFEQQALHAGDIGNVFRSDGSTNLWMWNIKPFARLIRSTASDLSGAQPPAGPPGIRDAWADGPEIDIDVRHSEDATYLSIHNRRTEPYSGMLTYRNRAGELLHLHANIGPQRHGVVLLHGEEIVGVAFTGDASEGVWLVRAMRSSIVFNGGSGGVTPIGRGVVLMAAQSGRFQLRRMEGWANIQSYRLTMRGQLLACPCQIEAHHLTVPYVAEDQHGQTDQYLILETHDPLPDAIGTHLRVLLQLRANEIRTAASICRNGSAQQLLSAANSLESMATGQFDLNDYRNMWGATTQFLIELFQQIQHEQAKLQFNRRMSGEEPPSEEEFWRTQALALLQPMLHKAQ